MALMDYLPGRRTAVPYIKAFCWLGLFCAAVPFFFFYWITFTRFFQANNADLIKFYGNLHIYYKWIPKGHAKTNLLNGANAFVILWQFSCTVAVGFFAAILLSIELYEVYGRYRGPGKNFLTSSEPSDADDAFSQAVTAGKNSNQPCFGAPSHSCASRDWTVRIRRSRVMTFVRRVLFYQLPPRGVWFYVCDGFTVLDLLLVLTWFMIHLMWTYEMSLRRYNKYHISHIPSPPPPSKLKSPPPGSYPPHPPPPPPSSSAIALAKAYDRTMFNYLNYSIMQMLGQVNRFDLLLLFYPVSRSNFLHWITGSDFPTLVRYHRWMGKGTIMSYTIHGLMSLGYYDYNGGWKNVKANMVFLMTRDFNNVAGLISLLFGWLIFLTSITWFRRRHFNIFLVTHIFSTFIFFTFAFMHKKSILGYTAPGIILYVFDLVLRHTQNWFNRATVSSAVNARVNDEGSVVSLSLVCDKSFHWVGSDIIFLHAPEISWWQWHPFTTTSAALPASALEDSNGKAASPETRVLQLHVKKYDRWTREFIARLQQSSAPMQVNLGGPYHGAARKWLNYDNLLLIAGGIGVTPMLGIIRDIMALRAAGVNFGGRDGLPRKVKLIWLSRSPVEFGILGRDILDEMNRPNSWIQIELCDTSKQDGDASKSVDAGAVSLSIEANKAHDSKSEEAAVRARIESSPFSHPVMGGHPLIWLTAFCLSFGGGFCGILLELTYDVNRSLYVKKRKDFSFIGMLQMATILFGAGVPPLVFLLAVRIYTAIRALRRRADGKTMSYVSSLDSKDSKGLLNASSGSLGDEDHPVVELSLKGNAVTASSKATAVSAIGAEIERISGINAVKGGPLEGLISWGRPDFPSILRRHAEEAYNTDARTEVGVFVGGPEPLVGSVLGSSYALNGMFGQRGCAFLDVYPLTHSL